MRRTRATKRRTSRSGMFGTPAVTRLGSVHVWISWLWHLILAKIHIFFGKVTLINESRIAHIQPPQ